MIIYKITNLINGKIYIGKTIRPLNQRLNQHKTNKKSLIGRAIQKYGWENFKAEVVEECSTYEELNEREMYWIKYFNCKHPNGYNMTDGGDGSRGCSPSPKTRAKLSLAGMNQVFSPERRAKISAANKGRVCKPETRAKLSAANTGRSPSPETRAKVSKKLKGRIITEEAKRKMSLNRKNKKPVRCIETGEVFESISAAARHYNISVHHLSSVCNGHRNMTGGKHWEFVKD